MLGLAETSLFYLVIGIGVGAAVLLHDDELSSGERCFRVLSAVLFWPVYIPALLQGHASGHRDEPVANARSSETERPRDAMDETIDQVETELDAALNSLGGWAENVLAREDARFSELRSTWRSQAEKIRELDSLLEQPEFAAAASSLGEASALPADPADARFRQTEQSRLENIERLRAIRRQMHDDLMGTLAWVRELVTMIHLAKFTGAPASRAEELVARIAAAVEGLSEVAEWEEDAELQAV